jgi:hypothetical protein
MPADNATRLIAAAQRRHELTRSKAIQALRELEHAGSPVTFESVARVAGVSRSWLYTQPDLKADVQRLRETARQAPASQVPASQKASDASLLRRLEAANQRNRELAAENQQLRRRLARALGDERAARGTRQSPSTGHVSATIGPC